MNKLKRREFLGLGALMLCVAPMLSANSRSADTQLQVSAATDDDGKHWVVGFSSRDGLLEPLFQQALPARGHHVAVLAEQNLYIAIARRPGTWLVLGDLRTGEILSTLNVPADRHLYGHGIFSADGRCFYTTESNFADMTGNSGLVVEWKLEVDAGRISLVRGAEFSTNGVGPHELLLMPGSKVIAVANGGIRTHPDSDREILNAESMQPSLVYLDRQSGEVLEQAYFPDELHQASIRHLAVNSEGLIAMGLQYQGEPFARVPLLATHRQGEALRTVMLPELVRGQMHQYVGSVCFAGDGVHVASSCPRGNMILIWNAHTGELVKNIRSRDGCGLAATESGFVFSSGTGRVANLDLSKDEITTLALPPAWHLLWDNHLSPIV